MIREPSEETVPLIPREDLSYKNIFIRFGSFAYKSLISRMLELSAGFGGSYLLSLLGSDNLAAAGLISSTQNFLIRTGRLSLFGMPAMFKEASNTEETAEVLQQSRVWGLILSIPIILLYSFSGSILIKLGQNETISYLAQDFLRAYTWGIPATLIQTSNLQYLYFRKDLWTACLINFLQTAMTLSFGYILTNGFGSFAGHGAAGLGHANALAAWITCVGTTTYIAKRDGLFQFSFFQSLPRLKRLIIKGLPIGIQQGSELFALTVAVQMSGLLKIEDLVAAEAVSQWIFYVAIPMQTLAQTANTLISIELKENNITNARKYGDCSVFVNMIIPILSFILFVSIGRSMANLFIKNSDDPLFDAEGALNTAEQVLIISGIIQILDAIRTGFSGSLRAYNYVKVPAITGVANLCVIALALSYVFGFSLNWGVVGIFGARIIPTIIDGAILTHLWRKVSRPDETNEGSLTLNSLPKDKSDSKRNERHSEESPKIKSWWNYFCCFRQRKNSSSKINNQNNFIL